MKNKFGILMIICLIFLTASAIVSADGGNSGYWQNYGQNYPVPQYYPNGQQNTNTYNYPYYSTPQPQYQQNQIQLQNQLYPIQNNNNTYPYNQYDPGNSRYYYQCPYNYSWSDTDFYWIGDDQNCWPYQPYYPYYPGNNSVQVSKQWGFNGSVNLTWTIYNTTNENWYRTNIDIKCVAGCHLLTNPNQTLWDIPYTVNRGGPLSFTVNIWPPMYGETMTFTIVAGSKTLYTFNVNPN